MSEELVFVNLLDKSGETGSSDHPVGPSSHSWLTRVTSIFNRFINHIKVGRQRVIRLGDWERERQRRHRALAFGFIALVFFGLAVIVGWRKRIAVARDTASAAAKDHADYAIASASTLSELDPARAYELLSLEATQLAEEAARTTDQQLRRILLGIGRDVEHARDAAAKIITVRPDVYLDLSLVREGSRGFAISTGLGEDMYVLDAWLPAVLSVSSAQRAASVIGGGDLLKNARAIAGGERAAFVLTPHTIVNMNAQTLSATTVVGDDEGIWSDPIALSFFDGNLYLMDRGISDLYKYLPTSSPLGFGERHRWFRQGVTPNLSDAVDLAVNGHVWILHKSGRIDKFDQGIKTEYRLQWPQQLVEPVKFSVPPSGANIWVLDRGGRRVVAFDQELGNYVGQWTSDVFADAQDLVVNEELHRVFVLVNEKIYTFEVS